MNDPTLPVAVVSGGFTVIVALIGIGGELLRRQLGHVKHEVKNSHTTNLRDDIDKALDALDRVLGNQDTQAEMLREHGHELGHLRSELQTEREERMAVSKRLDSVVEQTASHTAAVVAAVVGDNAA